MGKSKRRSRQQPNSVKVRRSPGYDAPAKQGPGMVLREESFAEPGQVALKKRVRNQGEHPLTLAFERGHLEARYPADVPERDRITAKERLAAGEEYRRYFEQLHRSGRDSLDMTARGGGTGGADFKQVARDWIAKTEGKMHLRDVVIIRHFCGQGLSMADALRAARLIPHPDGAAWRVREALDDLVAATTGRRLIPTPLDAP